MAGWRILQGLTWQRAALKIVAGRLSALKSPCGNIHNIKLNRAQSVVSRFSFCQTDSYSTQAALNVGITEQSDRLVRDINGHQRELLFIWLRDHCRCEKCYNHDTLQKNFAPHDFSFDIKPSNIEIIANQELKLTWEDGHVSSFTFDWLQDNSYPGFDPSPKFLWNAEMISKENIQPTPYAKFQEEEEGVKELMTNLVRYGFGIVDGCGVSVEATQKVVERVCFIQKTFYGEMYDFTADLGFADTAYTNLPLGAHNDTTYFTIPCGIQVFHCLYHDGEGGETRLVDGFHAAEALRLSDPHAFELLRTVRVHHENIDKTAGVYMCSLDPILKTHPITGSLEWIRYNHYDRAPIRTIPPGQIAQYYSALAKLSAEVESPTRCYWKKLKPGMVLFIDNWRVMHGRSAFTGKRRLCGCYLPRDDWVSRAATLGLKHML